MSKPDWTTAPQGATHWDTEFDGFCIYTGWWYKGIFVDVDYHDDWGTGRYIERPPADQSMPADLEHLARTVLEWSKSLDRVCKHTIGVEWFSSEHCPGRHGYSEDEWLQARRGLGLVTTEGEDEAFDAMGKRDVFEEIEKAIDALGKWGVNNSCFQAVSAKDDLPYSKYFRDVSRLDSIDVYEVHRLFTVEDHALCHASKKILLAGTRTGGKTMEEDIREARDTLNRWLEMEREL